MNTQQFNIEEILQRIDQQVRVISRYMKLGAETQAEDIFFDNTEFQYLMNISKGLAQKWRDQGIIPYSQIGGKIYYKLTDIKMLLDSNYIKSNLTKKDYTTNI